MTVPNIATADKLAEVEKMIERERLEPQWDHFRLNVLRSIAKDLHAKLGNAPSEAMVEIERRVNAVHASKTSSGYDAHALRGLAEGVVVRWAVVKQALERFGAAVEAGDAG